ncbi:MAG TPA: glycosyltransferase [Candidatus Synoicihabitans sp.]|nr:glycosyltransferase [Candidatus Synoicihabitans sp.]
MSARPPTIAYLFTTFPKATETFLQREVRALIAQGAHLRLYSLFGGGGTFAGQLVTRFSMWQLIELIWIIPWVALRRWDVFGILLRGLLTRRAPGWLNFWENMLGAGFAGVFYREFRAWRPDLIHAAWGGAPATAAWILSRLNRHRFSAAAHAYDLYEHGGDWWLDEKLRDARFIHTSTEMAGRSLIERGHRAEQIHVVRRGLDQFPPMKPLRASRLPLRILCVARLVPKKGLNRQMRLYAHLADAGVKFEARIAGEGPLMGSLQRQIDDLGLSAQVSLLGHLSQPEVWAQYEWADVLLHTGVVAQSGDRDGLPNVIPEAMAAGVLVVSSTAAATGEAVEDRVTGRLIDVDRPVDACEVLRTLITDDAAASAMQAAARRWAEENYNARENMARLYALLRQAAA